MSIKWNIFHPDVYATASQDWTLKIWSQKRPQIPLFNFELGAPVNDIDWAPFSSTVICGVTEGDNSRYEIFQVYLMYEKQNSFFQLLSKHSVAISGRIPVTATGKTVSHSIQSLTKSASSEG